ncbi:uncharacterized protein THITE_2015222, partial [Thermothielavioides terrestris NRRL 8126]
IRPSTNSIDTPILFVLKKGGELYFVVDYYIFNHIIYKNYTPIPLIDKILNRLSS